MRGEIIFTGTELLLGQILNTNAQYLQQVLADLGIDIYYQVTVGDNLSRLVEAIGQASQRAELIIIGGGLGPTEDDLSREALSRALNLPLTLDNQALKAVRRYFDERKIEMTANNLKQALVPESGLALDNPVGTAPGIVVERPGHTYFLVPGPPMEFKFMIDRQVVPHLVRKLGSRRSIIKSRVLKLCGIGESVADERLGDLLHSSNPTLAPTSRFGEVHLRITAKADNPEQAEEMNDEMEARVRERLGEHIFGKNGETLAGAVGNLLSRQGLTVATAETCTGGLLAHQLTIGPKAGDYFMNGFVFGAGSINFSPGRDIPPPKNDRELAEHLVSLTQEQTGAGVCIAVTGQLQISGQEDNKPGGLVYVATGKDGKIKTGVFNLWGPPPEVRERAVQVALILLWRTLSSRPVQTIAQRNFPPKG